MVKKPAVATKGSKGKGKKGVKVKGAVKGKKCPNCGGMMKKGVCSECGSSM
jgi:PHP family Zn ribbon phosphoesterase